MLNVNSAQKEGLTICESLSHKTKENVHCDLSFLSKLICKEKMSFWSRQTKLSVIQKICVSILSLPGVHRVRFNGTDLRSLLYGLPLHADTSGSFLYPWESPSVHFL